MGQERPGSQEERRLVTVLFADLVGYTTVSEAHDPELIQESLNLCFDRLTIEIQRFGGYVDKVVGDEIMALFGAPKAQEDDAGKAVAAALAMRGALEELTPQLQERLGQGFRIRIGINTGLVVTGAIGPGGYTVTGDAVNVAARLEKAGGPGTITVGDTTRRLARRTFRWGDRQELTVKGRTEPVVCHVVEGQIVEALRLVPLPSDTPFVGRDEHVRELADAWAAVVSGAGRIVELVGEAGIGKTRLLAHVFATVDSPPRQVLYTRADTPPTTFGPLMQLLPSLREDLPKDFERRIEALADVQDTEAPPVEPDWLARGLMDVARRLCERGPVVLVLDDVHRADRATINVADKLLPQLASLPVLTLLLRQPTGRRPRRIPEDASVHLEPLGQEQAQALVAGRAPELPPDRVNEIVARAGGNPLYLELLATAVSATPGVAVPESLQTAVVARIDELDDTVRRLLREASVFGQSFYEEPLKLTTTVSEGLYDTLAHLCRIGLLDELGDARHRGYQFRHSLVQEVLYQQLLLRQRAELHRRAAEALELAREEGMEVEPEQLAFHYREAGDTERAAAYHLAAAERAEHLRAPDEARSHRRAANQLLNMASLAGMYATHGRPSLAARAAGAGLQAVIATALVLPVFLLFAMRRPETDLLTLGLPSEIIEFNPASILLAIVLGGAPLLIAGIIFSHLAVPVLMRRSVSAVRVVLVGLGGWALALALVLAGYGVLIGLLRLGALDSVSSMYVGGTTLQIFVGNYALVWTALIGTFVVAVVWTALLRLQARGWARLRRSSAGPRQFEEGRRWALVRQLGLLGSVVGALAVLLLLAYQFGLLPNGGEQSGLGVAALGGVLVPFAALSVGGVNAVLFAGRRLRRDSGVSQLGLFGFEVPLIVALAFGVVAWFGMRQAVIVSANDVDTPGSVTPFNQAVALFPNEGKGYYLRGERYLANTDYERAKDDFDRAAKLDPDFPAIYLARGFVLIKLNDPKAAEADAARLIALRPDHPGGYAISAWAKSVQGDLAGAAQDLGQATKPLPKDLQTWDAHFVRCEALFAVQRLDEAEADCKRVLELNPNHIVSLDTLALIAFARGETARNKGDKTSANAQYATGIGYESRVLKINPKSALAHVNRGLAYSLSTQYEPAEADFTRAVELAPKLSRAFLERGYNRIYLDRPQDALSDLARAIELYQADPAVAFATGVGDGDVYASRLFVALYAGVYQTAIDDANTLEQIGQGTAWVLTTRGLARLESGDLQGGLTDINGVLTVCPGPNLDDAARIQCYALAYERRGYAYFLLGDMRSAEADFSEALKFPGLNFQEQAELAYYRALLAQKEGRLGEASNSAKEAALVVQVPSFRRKIEELQASLTAAGAAPR